MTKSLDTLKFRRNHHREENLLHHLHRTGVNLRKTTGDTVQCAAADACKGDSRNLLLTVRTFHDDVFISFGGTTSVLGVHRHGFSHGAAQMSVRLAWRQRRCLRAGSRKIQPTWQRERNIFGRQHCIFRFLLGQKVFPFSTQCDLSSDIEHKSTQTLTMTRSDSAKRSQSIWPTQMGGFNTIGLSMRAQGLPR